MGRRLRIPFKSQSVSRIMLFVFRIGVNQVWLIRACSSAWLERTPDKREVGSSSLPRPTINRGRSSAGRAPALQAGGHRFEPVRLHQHVD